MGDKIKCFFYGNIICTANHFQYPKTCMLYPQAKWNEHGLKKIFGNMSKVKSFMKANRPVEKVMPLEDFDFMQRHFHPCERVGIHLNTKYKPSTWGT